MSALFLCLILSLVGLQQSYATSQPSQLQHETQQTLQKLQYLPSHCTKDMDSLIFAEQSKLPGDIFYCSITSIVIEAAEITVDTFFGGLEAYIAVPAFFNDIKNLKNCLNESSIETMATCALSYLPTSVEAAEVIVAALENYVGEMQMIVPLLMEEVEECFQTSVSQYKAFLESVVVKATTCSQ